MPDLWFYGILNFLKKRRRSSNFRKIRAIVLKLHTNILHPSRNFGIEFGQNRLKRSNFFRFWIFWNFFQNCLTQENFELSSWSFVGRCINTEWCLRCINTEWPLNFRRIWFFFLSWHQIIKIRCIHEALSVRKLKLSFVKSVRKQYGNPDSHPFFFLGFSYILLFEFLHRSLVGFRFLLYPSSSIPSYRSVVNWFRFDVWSWTTIVGVSKSYIWCYVSLLL